jgi:hypothetical protein
VDNLEVLEELEALTDERLPTWLILQANLDIV